MVAENNYSTSYVEGSLINVKTTGAYLYFNGSTYSGPLVQFKTSSGGLYNTKINKYYRLYVDGLSYDTNSNSTFSFNVYPYFIWNGQKLYYANWDNLLISGTGSDNIKFGFDYVGVATASSGEVLNFTPRISNVKFNIHLYELSDAEVADLASQDKINQSVQQGNQLQKEANETGKGILGKITDFFGSFFENIINALKSLFIPEDGYFSEFFTRLNDFFSEKLGFLYEPIELFLDFLNAIQNASVGASPGLTFPEIKWEDDLIVPETHVDFSIVNEAIPELQDKIYFVTDIIMVGAVLILLEKKIDEVMHK